MGGGGGGGSLEDLQLICTLVYLIVRGRGLLKWRGRGRRLPYIFKKASQNNWQGLENGRWGIKIVGCGGVGGG